MIIDLGDGHRIEYFLDEVVGRDVLSLGFVTHRDAMAEDIGREFFNILWGHVSATIEERGGSSSEREIDCGPRRGPRLDITI